MERIISCSPVPVEFVPEIAPGKDWRGIMDRLEGKIFLRKDMRQYEKVRVLLHEVGHYYCGHAEVDAETFAFYVADALRGVVPYADTAAMESESIVLLKEALGERREMSKEEIRLAAESFAMKVKGIHTSPPRRG